MDISFDKVRGHFGFGCMRLPGGGAESADAEFCAMIDAFLDAGFNYFDTAHGYLDGNSEKALKRCLTSRYPRERYSLTDKLTTGYFHCEEDIRPFFESQLEACGVSYFDFYLMHAQSAARFEEFKRCRAYETAFALKEEGKIRHVGISFHDRPEVLDQILTEYPQIEVVQIQFNYMDYEDPVVLSRRVYEVCRKHQKPVIVMEPVKGGRLVELPKDAQAALHGALRHGQHGHDGGQPPHHDGFSASLRQGAGGHRGRAPGLLREEPDPLHRLPLLHRRLPHADPHPRSLRLLQQQTGL